MGERNHSGESQRKLTARNREGKGLRWTKQTEKKQESGGGGLSGQRQTERQDLPLSFQRERRPTASAERMKRESGRAWRKKKKVKRQQIHYQK